MFAPINGHLAPVYDYITAMWV